MMVYQISPRRLRDLENGVLPFAIWITRYWRKLVFQSIVLLILFGGSIAALAQTMQIQPNPDPWSPTAPPQSGKTAIIYISPGVGSFETLVAAPRIEFERQYLEQKGYNVEIRNGDTDEILAGLIDPKVAALSYFGHGTGSNMEDLDGKAWVLKAKMALTKKYMSQGMTRQEANAKVAQFKKFDKELVRNFACYSLADTSLAKTLVKAGDYYHGSPKSVAPCPVGAMIFATSTDFFLTEYQVPEDVKSTFRGTVAWLEGTSQAEPFKGDITFTFGDDIMEGTFNVVRGNFIRSASLKGSVDSDGKIDGAIEGTAERKPDTKPLAQETKDAFGGVGRTINTFDALIIGPLSRFTFKGKLSGKIGDDTASGQFEALGTREKGSPIIIKGSWSAKSSK